MELRTEEALRYLGIKGPVPEALRLETAAIAGDLAATLPPRYLYRLFAVERSSEQIRVPEAGLTLTGNMANTMLAQCDRVVLLACTLGSAFDAKLRTEQIRSMAHAVVLDACGSAWVEAGCDEAEREIRQRFPDRYLTDRFSPGYGDLPLALQPAICSALDTPRRLGLYVTDSLLMNPVKSVTALIGLSDRPQMARVRGCAHCGMYQTCALRKEGTSCAI